MYGQPQQERYTPHSGLTDAEIHKAFQPAGGSLRKAAAQVRRLSASLKESLKSEDEKKKIAKQARIDHQRVVLQKLNDLREQVRQSVIAGELTADEAATLENTFNNESARLYDKHVKSLTEMGARVIEPVTVGGAR
jgi:hypothetical protein